MCAASGAEEDDLLDLLMQRYEAQATHDLQAVASAPAPRPRKRARATASERRDAGLAAPIAEENKGFQMLARMGYQPGQGIGAAADGRAEPVAVDLKQNRLGLGAINKAAARREAQRQQDAQAAEQQQERRQQAENDLLQEGAGYQQRAAEQFAARRVAGQLRAAQEACLTLDTQAGVEFNIMWRGDPTDGDLRQEADGGGDADGDVRQAWEALGSEVKLAQVAEYLRTRYCYCVHCAARYSDAQDLAANCPGPDEADH